MNIGLSSNGNVEVPLKNYGGDRLELLVNNVCNIVGLRRDLREMSFVADFSSLVSSTLDYDEILIVAARKLYEYLRFNLLAFSPGEEICGSSKVFCPGDVDSKYYNSAEILIKYPGLAARNIFYFPSLGFTPRGGNALAGSEFSFELSNGAGYVKLLAEDGFPENYSENFPARIFETLSIALRNSEIYEKVREQSMRDSLTGLYNRRVLEDMLEREDRKRGVNPLSLLIIDLDNFKNINDTYGHPCGDLALRTVAGVLLDNSRGTDVVARNGGEEFAVMLPSTSAAIGLEVGERLRKSIEKASFMWEGAAIRLTASIGISHRPCKEFFPAKDMISQADQALYRAKNTGKNRVCFFSSSPVIVESK